MGDWEMTCLRWYKFYFVEMKTYYFFIVLFFLQSMIGCSNSIKKESESMTDRMDTIVGKFDMDQSAKKRYLIINGDTSDLFIYLYKYGHYAKFSIVLDVKPSHSYIEYIVKKNIDISVDKEFPADSLTYNQKIQELEHLFRHMSMSYDFSKLKELRFDVSKINGLMGQIGKTLSHNIDSLEKYDFVLRSIETTVAESNIISDLKNIFSQYGITVEGITIWEGKFLGNLYELIDLYKKDKQKLSKAISSDLLISCFISVGIKKLEI